MKDFFISYNKADRAWAEWIAWTLEEAGHSVVIQAWDFRPGENFALKMQDAAKDTRQTIAVMSEAYLGALFTQAEWAAAFTRDPKGEHRTLIPVRVEECQPEGVLGPTIYVDLVGLSEKEARTTLLTGITTERSKPETPPAFPLDQPSASTITDNPIRKPARYPGVTIGDQGYSVVDIPSNLPTGIPFFTGREDVLKKLEEGLKPTGSTALAQRQVISGLGGIGKTQTAIEYARRHRHEYKALLWAVAESKESLISDFVAIASVLKLPEANAPDQTFVVTVVRRWLETNRGWLLILDNADDLILLEDFLPESVGGHLLLTSRAQVFDALGILTPIELEEMTPEDANDFLLSRTGRRDLGKDEGEAVRELAKELDYLPLALEQAGAYIKELRSSFHDYLASYYQRGLELLEKGHTRGKYRKSVRTTWSLNFQQVEETSIASANLLRVSAFLSPDRIPAEIFTQGGDQFGPELSGALGNVESDPLIWDEILVPLIRYSLIHRDRSLRTFDIHRLVQAVLKAEMNERAKVQWAQRLIKALAYTFPDVDKTESADWYRIDRLLPHAQVVVELVRELSLESKEAANLLNLTGRYLHKRGRLTETIPLYKSALSIREKLLQPDDPDLADSFHNQGWFLLDQAKYEQAESFFLQALRIKEKALGDNHVSVAQTLNVLGMLYADKGRFQEARKTYERALTIYENSEGPYDSQTAATVANLAELFRELGDLHQAETLIKRSLEIAERNFGAESFEVVSRLHTLAIIYSDHANLYSERTRYHKVESLLLRVIGTLEKTFGPSYPPLGKTLTALASHYIDESRYPEAEALYLRAQGIYEGVLGPDHPEVAVALRGLARLYKSQRMYTQSEAFLLRALAIREGAFGSESSHVASTLSDLGELYCDWRKYSKGEMLLRKAVPILANVYGRDSQDVVRAMFVHANLLRGMNRKGEAQKLQAQAEKIRSRLYRKHHRG